MSIDEATDEILESLKREEKEIDMMINNYLLKKGLMPVFVNYIWDDIKKSNKYHINLKGGYSKSFKILDGLVFIDEKQEYTVEELLK